MTRIPAEVPRILILCIFVASVMAALMAYDREAKVNRDANKAFDDKDYEQALDGYERVSEEWPKLPEPVYNAANAHYELEDYEQALEDFWALDTHVIDDKDLLSKKQFNQGNVHFQLEEYEDAIEEYKEVLRENPDDVEAKHNLELALRQLEEQQQQEQEQQQQQQEQQQGQGDQPGPPDQPDDEGDDEQEGPEGDREGVGEDPEGEQRGDGSEQESQELDRPGANPQQQEMTPGQALQFLEAVGQNTDTLQGYLQRQFAPTSPPERDW